MHILINLRMYFICKINQIIKLNIYYIAICTYVNVVNLMQFNPSITEPNYYVELRISSIYKLLIVYTDFNKTCS